MRFVSYNIQYSLGKDERYDLERVVKALDGADVIALQEVERCWPRTGMADQPAEISALLPEYYWVFAPFFDMQHEQAASTVPRDNRRRQFGPMLLSKTPIVWSRAHPLPKVATFNRLNMDTGCIEATIETPSSPLRVFSLHLSALDVAERLMQIETLLSINARANLDGPPWTGPPVSGVVGEWDAGAPAPRTSSDAILMGDFNSEPHDGVYERLVGPLDQAGERIQRVDRFVDTWAAIHGEEIGKPTWISPPGHAHSRDMRLDYCFVSASLATRIKDAWVDSAAQGSDHQPFWVDMDL